MKMLSNGHFCSDKKKIKKAAYVGFAGLGEACSLDDVILNFHLTDTIVDWYKGSCSMLSNSYVFANAIERLRSFTG
jgi:hypothetical protein